MPENTHVLITFALDDDLVEQIRAVDPQRVEVEVLGAGAAAGCCAASLPERERARSRRQGPARRVRPRRGRVRLLGHRAALRADRAAATGGNVPVKTIREAAPNLKWIQLTSAGADRLLNSGFIEQGITVTTVSGLHATPIGEFVIGAMLQWAKGAPRTMRAQLKHEWTRFAPTELFGKTVGIVGIGHIGAEAGAAREGVRLPRHRDEAQRDGADFRSLRRRDPALERTAASARRERLRRAVRAADARHARHDRRARAAHDEADGMHREHRARRRDRRIGADPTRSATARSPAPRSTSSTRSRSPPTARCGTWRTSSCRRTSPAAPKSTTVAPRRSSQEPAPLPQRRTARKRRRSRARVLNSPQRRKGRGGSRGSR